MRHEDRGGLCVPQYLADVTPHVPPQVRVQVRERLVEQHHARLGRKRPRKRDALLLPAGELVRHPLCLGRHADELQRLLYRPIMTGAVRNTERYVLTNGQMREERIVLKHHAHTAALRRQKPPRSSDGLAVDRHCARVGGLESGDKPQRRRLAAATRAQERHHAAAFGIERGLTKGGCAVERLCQPLDSNSGPFAVNGRLVRSATRERYAHTQTIRPTDAQRNGRT